MAASVAGKMYPQQANRWLLIGAAALAIVAGIATFALLAGVNDSSDTPKTVTDAQTASVLVAKDTIKPNTKLSADMFESRPVATAALVAGAVKESSRAVGQVTRSEILKGEQISENRLGLTSGKLDDTLAPKIPAGKRAVAVAVDEVTSVAGLLVPGDRIDVIATFDEGQNTNNNLLRVETVLQDVEVLAFAQKSLKALPASGDPAAPATDTATGVLGERTSDLDPNSSAKSVTLALTPAEAQLIVAAAAKGKITLSLRPLGEEGSPELKQTNLDDFGFLPPVPRPGAVTQ